MTEPSWRRWLEHPAVDRARLDSAPTRRRTALRRPTARAGAPSPHTSPDSGKRGPGKIVAFGGAAVVAGVGVALLAGAGGHPAHKTSARPYAIITTTGSPTAATSTAAAAPPFCAPGKVGNTVVTNAAGDRGSGPGVIAMYEYAYFVLRDPKVALDVSDRGPGLPSEAGLAQGIADTAVGVPWCVSVTPLGGDLYETSVRYLPAAAAAPVLWLLHVTATPQKDGFTITRIEDQAAR